MSRNNQNEGNSTLNSSSRLLLQNILDSQGTLIRNVAEIDKKLAVHIESSQKEFEAIRILDERQNQILSDHSNRSTQLEKSNVLREASLRKDIEEKEKALQREIASVSGRVQSLEEPRKWWKHTKVKVMAWGATLAILLEILKYALDLLHK